MKQAKNVKVGSVVRVPEGRCDLNRRGLSGCTFTVGIVREIGVGKLKDGEKVKTYTVEYPNQIYSHTCNKSTTKKAYTAKYLFDASFDIKSYSETILDYSREDMFDEDFHEEPTYGAHIEFLIDNGIIKETTAE